MLFLPSCTSPEMPARGFSENGTICYLTFLLPTTNKVIKNLPDLAIDLRRMMAISGGAVEDQHSALYCLEVDKITLLLLTFATRVIYYAEHHIYIED